MSKSMYYRLFAGAAVLLVASGSFAQTEIQVRPRQLPGWDPRAREGRCAIRVWVDNRAELRMRGDVIFLRAVEGARGYDEGSECSQPLPYNSIRDFQVQQTAGRGQVSVVQQPSSVNNYTALISIEDRQGGGNSYALDVTWQSDGVDVNAPAPFYDEVRACQDVVRQRFHSRNGNGSYIDFDNFSDRQLNPNLNGNKGKGKGGKAKNKGRNRDQETIQGRGSARSSNETRDLTYSCAFDSQQRQIFSGDYRFADGSVRTNERSRLK